MLTKRKNSPYWYAVIYEAPGTNKWFSTKQTSKKLAQAVHDKLVEKYKQERTEKHLNTIFGIDEPDTFPVSALKNKLNILKKISASGEYNLNIFLKWLRENKPAVTDIKEINLKLALEYLSTRYGKAKGKTYNNTKSSLGAIWHQLAVYDIEDNIWYKIPNKAVDSIPYRAFTDEEVINILNYLKNRNSFWYNATLISYYTGLRKKDICLLKWDQIKDNHIELIPSKTKRNKKAVHIHLHPILINLFVGIKHTDKYVFPEIAAKYGNKWFELEYVKLIKEAGIVYIENTKASFHSLRVTFVTNCKKHKIPYEIIQGIVGHKSPAMTQHYNKDTEGGKVITELHDII